MTQKQVATRLGMEQGTVAKIERGDWAVTLELLVDFYWAYNTTLQKLPGDMEDLYKAVYAARRQAGAEEPE